jgi:hypothetical protein
MEQGIHRVRATQAAIAMPGRTESGSVARALHVAVQESLRAGAPEDDIEKADHSAAREVCRTLFAANEADWETESPETQPHNIFNIS